MIARHLLRCLLLIAVLSCSPSPDVVRVPATAYLPYLENNHWKFQVEYISEGGIIELKKNELWRLDNQGNILIYDVDDRGETYAGTKFLFKEAYTEIRDVVGVLITTDYLKTSKNDSSLIADQHPDTPRRRWIWGGHSLLLSNWGELECIKIKTVYQYWGESRWEEKYSHFAKDIGPYLIENYQVESDSLGTGKRWVTKRMTLVDYDVSN